MTNKWFRGMGGLLAAVLVMFAINTALAADTAALKKNFDDYAERVRAARADKASNNLSGGIAWGDSYELDSYILMFKATGDGSYMDDFVMLADMIVTARGDKAGMPDSRGLLRRGWVADGPYTLGQPVTVLDMKGNPALEIQAVMPANNDNLAIEVVPDAKDAKKFTLSARNLVTGQVAGVWEGVTMDNVEARVNAPDSALKVKKVGAGRPGKCLPFTAPTLKAVLHPLHTGKIGTPLCTVQTLIKKNPEMAGLAGRGFNYTTSTLEAFPEMEKSWVAKGNSGCYAFEKNAPVADAGKPAPVYAQAATGTGLIYMSEASGDAKYMKRAEQLANYVKSAVEVDGDGAIKIDGKKAANLDELQLVLRFMNECAQRKMVFTSADLEPFAKSFSSMVGDGAAIGDCNLAGYMMFGGDTLEKCQGIFMSKFTSGNSAKVLYGWAMLNYMASDAAKAAQ